MATSFELEMKFISGSLVTPSATKHARKSRVRPAREAGRTRLLACQPAVEGEMRISMP